MYSLMKREKERGKEREERGKERGKESGKESGKERGKERGKESGKERGVESFPFNQILSLYFLLLSSLSPLLSSFISYSKSPSLSSAPSSRTSSLFVWRTTVSVKI